MTDRLIFSVPLPNGEKQNLYEPASGSPEIFVDGIQGMMGAGSVVKLNMFTREYPSEGEQGERRRMACRLTMTVETFMSLAKYFTDQAARIEQDLKNQPKAN